MITNGYIAKTDAALITTTAFITYGAGQLLSGLIGDYISPRILVFCGMLTTSVMNIMLPSFISTPILMIVIWGINGLAQAFMWPPLVKIMITSLSGDDYSKAIPYVSVASSVATIVIYLISPAIITYISWEYLFYICGISTVLSAFFWIISTGKLIGHIKFTKAKPENQSVRTTNSEIKLCNLLIKLLPVIIFSIILQGILRDGITTWLPNLLTETYNMSSTASIFSGVALPLFHTFNALIIYRVLMLFKNDVFKTMGVYFFAATILLALLFISDLKIPILSVVILSLTVGLMHGVNVLQISYLPKYFAPTGKISFYSGLLNFPTYIGAAISTYGIAVISENLGWNITLIFWMGATVIGAILAIVLKKAIKIK